MNGSLLTSELLLVVRIIVLYLRKQATNEENISMVENVRFFSIKMKRKHLLVLRTNKNFSPHI